MKVLILAAGYGTRIYPLTRNVPKALLSINSKPAIEYIIEKILHAGIKDMHIITNNKFFTKFSDWLNKTNIINENVSIDIINDNTDSKHNRLGAIGDIDYAIKEKNIQEDLLIVASDNLFEFELDKFIDSSKSNCDYPTVGISDLFYNKKLVSKYGVVKIDSDNCIVEFTEKPKHPESSLVATGIYFFPRQSLDLISKYLKQGNCPDSPGYLASWLCDNYAVHSYSFTGHWYDIGSLEVYRQVGGDLSHHRTSL